MSLHVAEVYDAFKSVGASDAAASAAARSILVERDQLVTRDYLDARLGELKSDLKSTIITAMLGLAALFGGIVGALRLFA